MGKNIQLNKSYVEDLGSGFYAYFDTELGSENIEKYLEDKDFCEDDEDESGVILDIEYEGRYTRCIYGDKHEDYMVLFDLNAIKINDFEYVEY